MLDIRKACRWKFPKVSYTNFHKEYPSAKGAFTRWFHFERRWSGKIWNIGIKHRQITLDFRLSPLDDMVFPTTTKEDRKAVDDALNG